MTETQPQRWTKVQLSEEERAEITVIPQWAIRDDYSRLALCWGEVDVDQIIADHNAVATLRTDLEYIAKWGDSGMKQVAERALEATKDD